MFTNLDMLFMGIVYCECIEGLCTPSNVIYTVYESPAHMFRWSHSIFHVYASMIYMRIHNVMNFNKMEETHIGRSEMYSNSVPIPRHFWSANEGFLYHFIIHTYTESTPYSRSFSSRW